MLTNPPALCSASIAFHESAPPPISSQQPAGRSGLSCVTSIPRGADLMESGDPSYAPESPDLTAFDPSSNGPNPVLHPQHRQYRGSFALASPTTSYQPPQQRQHSLHQLQQQQQQAYQPPPQQQQHQQQAYHNPAIPDGQDPAFFHGDVSQQQPQHFQQFNQQDIFASPGNAPPSFYQEPDELRLPGTDAFPQGAYLPPQSDAYVPPMGRRKVAQPASYAEEDEDASGEYYDAEESERPAAPAGKISSGPEVKTKFPVARIKRIMQADEDVGKVAQVTPVVVSKALELFMISLVTKSAEQARSRSSKRVTSAHMKQAVLADPQFDFLTDIVGKVQDAPAKAEKAHDDGDGSGEPKRRKTASGASKARKKKAGDPADDDLS